MVLQAISEKDQTLNYTFDKLVEISQPCFSCIDVGMGVEGWVAYDHITDTIARGPDPIVALERLVVSLKISQGYSLVEDADVGYS